ncbi:hypothetical protein GCM10011494_24630 [Novosphingobium endophyticum]|uniref:DUF2934 domain-containing protein n=1 Tax=Novosphingobium endophyticum TaxID=1955250 RepID=A0A916TT68_9SPHN|nr:DUF2934 domain-containing protein [Novosphingobium endophyticum]GGC05105.1 hypothetical protein GCM10011494_24630 [Novosphingobium endophyticum]
MADQDGRIRERAHELWEKEGRPQGQEHKHWLQAEREIAAEGASKSTSAKGNSPPGKPAQGEPAKTKTSKAAPQAAKPKKPGTAGGG